MSKASNRPSVNFWVYPARIGEQDGPCSEHCSHIPCILKRLDAERPCLYCQKAIGWNAEVYFCGSQGSMLAHRQCMEDRVTELLAKWAEQEPEAFAVANMAASLWVVGRVDNAQFNESMGSRTFRLTQTGARIN